MFKSKIRSINVPQYEHGRLAGVLASLWGNTLFDKPALDFAAFVEGVALHDWHYGVVDDLPIMEANEADWLEMVRQGVDYRFANPVTDIVAKLHLKRLLRGRQLPVVAALNDQIETQIVARMPQSGFTREQFEWADKITKFCDYLAFDFCFEKGVKGSVALYTKVNASQEVTVTYTIGADGEIGVAPWPFSQPSFSGILIGYERAGYPLKLQPKVLPYRCQPV